MFRSLRLFNYRIWFIGALVSNIGTWMQRTAQDWLVYDILTEQDAAAMGIVMALQMGPQLVMAPWAGLVADRFDRQKLLMATQISMAALGLALGLMVIADVAQLWHVYAFALALGMVTAVDAPARQTFVSDVVRDDYLPNAVALNSTSFNLARMVGPALAGVLTVAIGPGPVFLINTATFAAMIAALLAIRRQELHLREKAAKGRGQILEGFRYVKQRPDLVVVLAAIFIIGTFGLNFSVFVASMARTEFGGHAGDFGLLSSVMAAGSVTGSLLSARRERPRLRYIFGASVAFGIACTVAGLAPTVWLFGLALVPVGAAAITIMTSANAYVQTTTAPMMRGRVMSLYMAILMGGTPIGAPLVGLVANSFGPRWGLGVAALSGVAAAAIGIVWAWRAHHMRLRFDRSAVRKLSITYGVPDRRA